MRSLLTLDAHPVIAASSADWRDEKNRRRRGVWRIYGIRESRKPGTHRGLLLPDELAGVQRGFLLIDQSFPLQFAQQPWVQNATLQDNILFGRQHDEKRFEEIVAACALCVHSTLTILCRGLMFASLISEPDIAILPYGLNTEIGEKVSCRPAVKHSLELTRCCLTQGINLRYAQHCVQHL